MSSPPVQKNSAIPFRLQAEEMAVDASLVEELLVATDLRNPPFLNNDNPVGHTHGGKPMGNQDRHFADGEFLKATEDLIFGLGVQ
jgi:hypothetical protein